MQTVTHDGRTTAYRVTRGARDGPVALYVHGSGGTHRVWANQYAPSGPTRPAAALDLSGHGESEDVDSSPGPDTLSAYAADVVAVARAVDADVLVGNSLGGAVAQWVTLEADWRPAALVLLGTGPSLPVFEGLREWLETDFDRAVEFLHGRDRFFHEVDDELSTQSREEMRKAGQAVTRRDFLTCHEFDVTDRLGTVGVPTLAVCGEHDTLTPRSYHERLASEVPDGEFALIPDAAHLVMVEQPELFNETVAEFLSARLSDGERGQSAQ